MKFYFHDHLEKESYLLTDGMIIGRSSSADLSIPGDDKLSSKHLEVSIKNTKTFIKDCNTSNGTMLNGNFIEKDTFVEVEVDDIIKIGRRKLSLSNQEVISEESLILFEHGQTKSVECVDNLRIIDMGLDLNKKSDKKSTIKVGEIAVEDYSSVNAEEAKHKRNIRDHKIKIKKLKNNIENYDKKIQKKNELSQKVEDIDQKYLNKSDVLVELKECYEEHVDEWETWNLKIKKLKRELSRYEEKRDLIAPKMKSYEEYLDDKKLKNTMIGEIKVLNRENLLEKTQDAHKKIEEELDFIEHEHIHLENLEKEKIRQKKLHKKRLKEEIKKLQAELEDVDDVG